MDLSNLPKTTDNKKKRVGRGYGSGRGGHTTGRGHKGQKSRNSVPLGFEGGQTPLIQRLPLMRGKDNINAKPSPLPVNVGELEQFDERTTVTREVLIEAHIVSRREAEKYGVKILGDGELSTALTVNLPCSAGAREKIESAGGSVEWPS